MHPIHGGVLSVTSGSVLNVEGSQWEAFVPTESRRHSKEVIGWHLSVTKVFHLSAAHHLPYHQGKCHALHGHNYKVEVTMTGPMVTGPGPESGMVRDFSFISIDIYDLIMIYDHKNLNDHYFNPTAEVLAFQWLQDLHNRDKRYSKVTVWETDDCCATVAIR
jgi:6-pyruvoyltetrahydropterin/6-carboxytetrahydropterin synthase